MDQNPQLQNQIPPAGPPPIQPLPPMQPQPPVNNNPTLKKSKKALIAGIIAGVVILGVAVVVVLFLTVFSGPSKEDYQEALAKVDSLVEADKKSNKELENDFTTVVAFNFNVTSEKQARQRLDKAKEVKKLITAKMNDLENVKAINNDKEIKDLYNKAHSEMTRYVAALDMMIENYEKISPEIIKMNSTFQSAERKDAGKFLDGMVSKFNKILPTLKTGANITYMKEVTPVLKDFADLLNGDIRGEEAVAKYKVLSNKTSAAYRKWQKNMREQYKEALDKAAVIDLKEALAKRASGVKD